MSERAPPVVAATVARPPPVPVQVARKCDDCRTDEEPMVQRAVDPAATVSFAQVPVVPSAPPTAPATVPVSEPSDASEQEADEMAERARRRWSSSAPDDAPIAPTIAGATQVARAADDLEAATGGGYLVDDDAATLLEGQMRKHDFLRLLREAVCEASNRELEHAGRSTAGCPFLDRWFDYYEKRDARMVERALRKYAPETSSASSAREYIPIIAKRSAEGARQWVETGEMPPLPEGVSAEMFAVGGILGAIGGALGGIGKAIGGLFFKEGPGGAKRGVDRGALEARLGGGRPLDGATQTRMSGAFGYDFARVRIHDDADAAATASRLNARAFTLGSHVAFARGRYQPGDAVGDALLAHELAHVVQQGGASRFDEDPQPAVEEDADQAAVGALGSLYGDEKTPRARPRLTSGLRLSRCDDSKYDLKKSKRTASQPPAWHNRVPMEAPLKDSVKRLWNSEYDVDHNTADNLSQGQPPVYKKSELVPDPSLAGAIKLPDEHPPWVGWSAMGEPLSNFLGQTAYSPSGDQPVIILDDKLFTVDTNMNETPGEKQKSLDGTLVHEMAHATNRPSRATNPDQTFVHFQNAFSDRWDDPKFSKLDGDKRAEAIKKDILSTDKEISAAYADPKNKEFHKGVDDYQLGGTDPTNKAQLDPNGLFGHYMTEFGARWVQTGFRELSQGARADKIKEDILHLGGGNKAGGGYKDFNQAYNDPKQKAFRDFVDDYDRPKNFDLTNELKGPRRTIGVNAIATINLAELDGAAAWRIAGLTDGDFTALRASAKDQPEKAKRVEDYVRAQQVVKGLFGELKVDYDIETVLDRDYGKAPTGAEAEGVAAELKRLYDNPEVSKSVKRPPTNPAQSRILGLEEFNVRSYQGDVSVVGLDNMQNEKPDDRGDRSFIKQTIGRELKEDEKVTPVERRMSKLAHPPGAAFYYPRLDTLYLPPGWTPNSPFQRGLARHELTHSLGGRDTTLNAFKAKYPKNFINYWRPFEEGMTELVSVESDPKGENTPPRNGNLYETYVDALKDKFKSDPPSRDVFFKAWTTGTIPDSVFSWLESKKWP